MPTRVRGPLEMAPRQLDRLPQDMEVTKGRPTMLEG
jgi:hypothetical protein